MQSLRGDLSMRSQFAAARELAFLPRQRQRGTVSFRQPTRALFTGIVQGKAKVATIDKREKFVRLQIEFPQNATNNVNIGASVAINGTCLTARPLVTEQAQNTLSFDVIEETLRVTNLGRLHQSSQVNFERSARMGDEIGGHTVSGHVHTTATVKSVTRTADNCRLELQVKDSPRWMKYILTKGFIALDGCSLTVGEVAGDTFCVYLIPETLSVTLFGTRQAGDVINVEVDCQTQAIVDTVERYMTQNAASVAAALANAQKSK